MKFTLTVFKQDKRTKSGEKLQKKYDKDFKNRKGADEEAALLMKDPKIRVTINETMKIVKNLLSGKDVEIRYDTPRACDPSTELYHTM